MNRQCKCTDCGYVFDYEDARRIRENHWLDGEYMGCETFICCPNCCGGSFEEAVDCCECGETFTENELYDGWCEKCLRETINYDTFFDFCEANKQKRYLDIFVMAELLGCMECPDHVSYDFHQLMISVYNERVKEIRSCSSNEYRAVVDILPACIRYIMDDDFIYRENYADWLNKMEGRNE